MTRLPEKPDMWLPTAALSASGLRVEARSLPLSPSCRAPLLYCVILVLWIVYSCPPKKATFFPWICSYLSADRFPYLSYPRHYRPEDHDKVREALEAVGLTELGGRKMDCLSGGQRQKVYLAMALAQDTDVILMDEPTTFLDIKNQFEMLNQTRTLAEAGKTVIMILHDFEAVLRYADHVVLMADGNVLCTGSAEDVLRSQHIREAFGVIPCFYEAGDELHCYVKA